MLRDQVYRELHGARGEGLTNTQRFVLTAIVAAVVVTIIGTEPQLPPGLRAGIEGAELLFGALFLIEYLARVWSIGSDPQYSGLSGRLRYMVRPFSLIDLLALLPFLIGGFEESLIVRAVRVLRLLALSKMLRYSQAMRIVFAAVLERRFELCFAFFLAGLMILLSSAALYVVEGARQPEAFGSIARAMWWSVITLTTVGYGDVVPVTALGKVFASITALAGIGMIAMPTGILAASFSDGFSRARAKARSDSP